MEIITRKAAHDSAMVHYFTGAPCIRGHVAPRYVITGNCVECNRTARPMRKLDAATIEKRMAKKPPPSKFLKVTLTLPRAHVAAMKEFARALCAAEHPPPPPPQNTQGGVTSIHAAITSAAS